MKKAQIIIEYAIISAFAVIITILLVASFNVTNLGSSTTFGVKMNDNTVVVPPMTP